MDLYDRRSGFTYLVLRFFLCMNTGVNLYVDEYEFLALVAMSLPLSPSVRCVTLASWFQAVYKHAYYYFGKLLYLSDEFPAPKDIFSGAVWTAFYLVYTREGQQYCHIHFPKETRRIRDDIDRILDDKKHIIPKLQPNPSYTNRISSATALHFGKIVFEVEVNGVQIEVVTHAQFVEVLIPFGMRFPRDMPMSRLRPSYFQM
ncbi:hypothetical protein LSAT2_031992 [Lamellibrachia satsuma]|nr:hypothetical protein LSAT2_031992 [Lamellibrachia satsuma]